LRICLIADSHWGARGDSQIFLDYFSRFYREFFFPYLDDHNIKTVIHLGDLVDRRKQLNYNTAQTMRREYIQPSIDRHIDTHMIVGNHDTYNKNNNEVNALREVVMGRPGFTIYSYPTVVSFDGVKTLMLPWISPDNEERTAEALKFKGIKTVFAHLELVGFEMTCGQMMDHGMDPKPFTKYPAVYTGHYHHKSSKKNIHYLGAPYEMNWNDYDDPKGFHIWDTETNNIEFIQNPIRLFEKVYTSGNGVDCCPGKIVKVIVTEGTDRKKLDKIISILEKDAIDVQVIDNSTSIENVSISIEDIDDTMKILKDYIESSDIEVDKNSLMKLMQELFVEANDRSK